MRLNFWYMNLIYILASPVGPHEYNETLQFTMEKGDNKQFTFSGPNNMY